MSSIGIPFKQVFSYLLKYNGLSLRNPPVLS